MNPYAYVGGNPETSADPTGHLLCADVCDGGGSSGGSTGGGSSTPPISSLASAVPDPSSWIGYPSSFTSQFNNYDPLIFATKSPSSEMSSSTSSSTPSWNDTSPKGITSCGAPGSQAMCGNYGVNYALYTNMGQIGVPGDFCFICGSPGGGGHGSEELGGYENGNIFASETGDSSGSTNFSDSAGESEIENARISEYSGPYDSNFPGANRDDIGPSKGFANEILESVHVNKHGGDFGASIPEEYVYQARAFMSGAPNADELQLTRTNGDVVRWNTRTGEFAVARADQFLRTYYDISSRLDAYEYFLKQYR